MEMQKKNNKTAKQSAKHCWRGAFGIPNSHHILVFGRLWVHTQHFHHFTFMEDFVPCFCISLLQRSNVEQHSNGNLTVCIPIEYRFNFYYKMRVSTVCVLLCQHLSSTRRQSANNGTEMSCFFFWPYCSGRRCECGNAPDTTPCMCNVCWAKQRNWCCFQQRQKNWSIQFLWLFFSLIFSQFRWLFSSINSIDEWCWSDSGRMLGNQFQHIHIVCYS